MSHPFFRPLSPPPFFFLLLTILVSSVAFQVKAQNSVEEAYEKIVSASKLKGTAALPQLEESYNYCRTSTCPDSTMALLYHRLGVAYFQAAIDDNQAVLYTDSARIFYQAYLPPNHIIIGNQWYNLAIMERIIGRTEQADVHMNQALSILNSDPTGIIHSLDSTIVHWYTEAATIKISLQDGDTGLGLAQYALEFAQRQQRPTANRARVEMLISNEHFHLGDFDQCKTFAQKAANTYLTLGNGEVQGLSIRNQVRLANTYFNAGLASWEKDRNPGAINYYRKAETILNNLPAAPSRFSIRTQARLFHNMAWYHIGQKNWSQAKQYIEESLALHRQILPHDRYPEIGNLPLLSAKISLAQAQYDTALYQVDQALAILYPGRSLNDEATFSQIIGPVEIVTAALDVRAQILAAQNKTQASLDQYSEIDKIIREQRQKIGSNLSQYALSSKIRPAYERAIGQAVALAKDDPDYLERAYRYCAQNKAIVFQQSLQNSRALSAARLPEQMQKEEKEQRAEIQEKQLAVYRAYQRDQPTDSLENVLFAAQQTYQSFIDQLEQEYPDYYALKYQEVHTPTLADVQGILEGQQLFIEYFVGQDNIYIFVADQQKKKVYELTHQRGLQDSIALFRELLTNGVEIDCESQFIQVSHYLYQQLLAPVFADFSQADLSRLLIIPDGLLNLISFEALLKQPVPQLAGVDGFLLEDFAFSYAFSSQMLLDAPKPAKASELFLGFGLEYDDLTLQHLEDVGYGEPAVEERLAAPCGMVEDTRYFGRLSHADDEVNNIADLLRGQALLNQEATKSTFLKMAAQHQVLHLAMHGVFDLNYPLNSALLFNYSEGEDAILRATEIYGMDLSSEMVVLSACNTAYGAISPGEGPMSLARAFHHAGTQSTVASLWSVSDYATAHIMQGFYEKLQEGLPKDEALRLAKIAYLNNNDLSSPTTRTPFYWAPAIVIGDVTPLESTGNNWWLWMALLVAAVALFFVIKRRKY